MPEETKVTETPESPKVSADESLIENPREKVEQEVIAENERVPERPSDDEEAPSKPEDKTPEPKQGQEEELSDIDKIKKSVQKRIDQVVAKQKSAEEKLAEAEAELARLRSVTPADKPAPKDDTPPTPEQVEAYILKMREEGNAKEEIAATRYLIKLEKEMAIKAVQDEQNKIRQEGEERLKRENHALLELAKDYVILDDKGNVDMKHDLTLANQKGKLFEVAMALYNDPELHKLYYADPDRANGLRRATADAYREIHQQKLVKTPKENSIESVVRSPRVALADPDSTDTDEAPQQSSTSNLLSDAEKVREEIKQRAKLRNSRKPPQ
jgi:hypothetical protein